MTDDLKENDHKNNHCQDLPEMSGFDAMSYGAGHSLARLFEATVTQQIHANAVHLATATQCVNAILENRPNRQKYEYLSETRD